MKTVRILFSIYMLVSIISNINPLNKWIDESRSQGLSYNRITWIKSPTIATLVSMNPEVKIYSNGLDVISLRTELQSINFPKKYDQNTLIQNKLFFEEINSMCMEVEDGSAIVVYFENIHRKYFPTIEEIDPICQLPILAREADGLILGVQR